MNFASQLTAVSAVPRWWDKNAPGPPSVHTQYPQTHTHTLFPMAAAQGIKGQKGQRPREVREPQARVRCGQTQSAPTWLLECRDRKLGLVPLRLQTVQLRGLSALDPHRSCPGHFPFLSLCPHQGTGTQSHPLQTQFLLSALLLAPMTLDTVISLCLSFPIYVCHCLPKDLLNQAPTSWVPRINPMAAWDRGRAPQTQRQGGWSANLILPPLPPPGSHSPAALP